MVASTHLPHLTSIPYAGRHLISPVYTLTAAFVVQGDIQY